LSFVHNIPNCLLAHATRSLPSDELHAVSTITEYQAYNGASLCGSTSGFPRPTVTNSLHSPQQNVIFFLTGHAHSLPFFPHDSNDLFCYKCSRVLHTIFRRISTTKMFASKKSRHQNVVGWVRIMYLVRLFLLILTPFPRTSFSCSSSHPAIHLKYNRLCQTFHRALNFRIIRPLIFNFDHNGGDAHTNQ
jgi:hypothetical protein